MKKRLNDWASGHFMGLSMFNVILIFLFLLRSVGYFDPFLYLTVNLVVMISLVLAILLLNADSHAMLTVVIIFWLFAAFLKIVKVDIWAERTSVYAFQTLVIAFVLMCVETIKSRFKNGVL